MAARINDIFSDATHVMLQDLDETTDLEVWQYAHKNDYTIVTKDSDFNDLVIYRGAPPKVIWLKLGNCRVSDIEKILRDNAMVIEEFLSDKVVAILEI